MDLITIMAALFLNLSMGCDAMPAEAQRVNGQDYLVQSWACRDKHHELHVWRTWQRECVAQNGATFWGRPYFLEDPLNHMAFYINRFGELQGGFGASIENAYVSLCGS
jgi:hypothetical protein